MYAASCLVGVRRRPLVMDASAGDLCHDLIRHLPKAPSAV
jgi:hypothetical protein